ncbi:hypothetical protein LshimejAT787_1500530 [Lyophyllum shimeji]|uniref:Uncharacterized protein n=1 Tax=Lyophyllum shimeji TaxID=47721 RepID=A0A9P3UQF5_LYOSH|nr:hypothetical protein LshimejAT787_1500530 [Lyophyllum shimeji]
MARSGASGKKRLLERTKGSAGTEFEKRLRELAVEADPQGKYACTTVTRTFHVRDACTGKGTRNYRRKVIRDLNLNWKKLVATSTSPI